MSTQLKKKGPKDDSMRCSRGVSKEGEAFSCFGRLDDSKCGCHF